MKRLELTSTTVGKYFESHSIREGLSRTSLDSEFPSFHNEGYFHVAPEWNERPNTSHPHNNHIADAAFKERAEMRCNSTALAKCWRTRVK